MAKKILFADDTKENRIFVQLVLQKSDYELFLASDGKEALDIFNQEQPDLVITDLYMPNLNGIQLLMQIRMKDKKYPVIGFTGADFDDEDEEVGSIGFTDMLHKPISEAKLMETIEKYI